MSDKSVDRMNGVCKWFSKERGLGFLITPDGKNYFVHYTNIGGSGFKTLSEGDKVSFLPTETEKGWAAHFVTLEK
jgi:CspA family cold shock protein